MKEPSEGYCTAVRACAVASTRVVVLGSMVAMLVSSAVAQEAAPEQAVDVAGIRAQLEENSRQYPPSAAGNKVDSKAQLDSEDMRLAEQEKALLAQISGKSGAPHPSPAPASPRASIDLDKAIDELTAPSKPQVDDTGIEVVVREPGASQKRFVSDPEIQAARLSSPGEPGKIGSAEEPIAGESTIKSQTSGIARTLESKLAEQKKSLDSLSSSNSALRSQLQSSQTRIVQLNRELSEARNRLMIAETEVERLSSVVSAHGGGVIRNQPVAASSRSPVRTFKPVTADSGLKAPQEARLSNDMMVATVIVDKAHLRTGPGKDNSPLMAVTRGTRLAVETRQADWYRVIAPTGARAWVASEVLSFGPTSSEGPTRTVQIRGYDSSREDEAVRLLNGER